MVCIQFSHPISVRRDRFSAWMTPVHVIWIVTKWWALQIFSAKFVSIIANFENSKFEHRDHSLNAERSHLQCTNLMQTAASIRWNLKYMGWTHSRRFSESNKKKIDLLLYLNKITKLINLITHLIHFNFSVRPTKNKNDTWSSAERNCMHIALLLSIYLLYYYIFAFVLNAQMYIIRKNKQISIRNSDQILLFRIFFRQRRNANLVIIIY